MLERKALVLDREGDFGKSSSAGRFNLFDVMLSTTEGCCETSSADMQPLSLGIKGRETPDQLDELGGTVQTKSERRARLSRIWVFQ